MVKRTITITTFFLVLSITVGLTIALNRASFAADDDIASGISGTCSWVIDKDGVLTISPTDGVSGLLSNAGAYNSAKWYSYRETITKVIVTDGVKTNTNCKCMFQNLENCIEMDLSNLDTSIATNMSFLFSGCNALTKLDVTSFNTSNVTDMNSMFSSCKSIATIDVTGFDTHNVTSMSNMFTNCENLTSIDLTNFDISNVSYMGSMFRRCSKITELNLNSFNTSSLSGEYAISNMFEGCTNLKRLDLNHLDVSGVTNFQSIFRGCEKLEQINVKDWNVSNSTNFNWTFENCSNLINLDLSGWNTSSATDMVAMFSKCSSLETLNISNFDTRNVDDYNGFFFKDNNLSSIKVGPNFDPIAKTTSTSDRVSLKTNYDNIYTDYWSREDNAYGPFLAEEWNTLFDRETMYGVWKRTRTPRTYSVEYYYENRRIPEGASSLPETKNYVPGEEVVLANDATATGWIFKGWKTNDVTITDGKFIMPNRNVRISGEFVTAGYIEYYMETLEEDEFELMNRYEVEEQEILTTDTEDPQWCYDINDYNYEIDGFKYEYVEEDDTQNPTLKLYYKRNSYNISYSYTGEVPDGASELPENQTYKYEEEISLPENPSAPGYTFSGWQTDHITMPAEDIVISGYFIKDDVSKEYKIEYYFDGEKDDSLDETMNAEINQEVSIDPQKSLNFNNTHYSLVSDNHKINVSENTEDNVIRVYYETDVLDYKNEKSTSGDGISDKYQVKIIYKVQNGTWNDGTSENKKQIINLYDKDGNPAENGTGKITIPQVGNKPDEGYSKGLWNAEIPEVVSNKDNGKEYIYSYAKIGSISEIKGNLSNPKTDDIVQSYVLYGAIAILLMLVVKRTINKYSRKKKKIQF